MDIATGYSYSEDPKTIVSEATASFDRDPGTILFFSPVSVFEGLTRELSEKYPHNQIFGASTYYSFFADRKCSEDYGTGTVIVAFGDSFACRGGVIEEIRMHPIEFAPAVARCMNEVEEGNTVCLTFTTAFFGSEELVLDTLASVIGDKKIHVAGSSCANEKHEKVTYVSYNGTVYSAASIFLFVHNRNGKIAVVKQDLFNPMRAEFRATSVDVRKRIIYELDGKPAAAEMARHLHYELYEMDEHMDDYGLGRIVGDDMYATEIGHITKEKGLEVLASVYGGTRLRIIERGRYDRCVTDMIAKVRKEIPMPRFMLYVNCVSLTRYYRDIDWISIFSAGLNTLAPEFAGISGFGEQLDRIHMNKTLLGIAFE
ncbi:MAG: hypothetical protein K6E85_06930 [Lachnospiraceae bacterium]|nr:hypothetical protein [Lachnospiraceae bacterium]